MVKQAVGAVSSPGLLSEVSPVTTSSYEGYTHAVGAVSSPRLFFLNVAGVASRPQAVRGFQFPPSRWYFPPHEVGGMT